MLGTYELMIEIRARLGFFLGGIQFRVFLWGFPRCDMIKVHYLPVIPTKIGCLFSFLIKQVNKKSAFLILIAGTNAKDRHGSFTSDQKL